MKAGELIAEWRRRADDVTDPTLWEDPELLLWLNEAQCEAARRARLLVDTQNKTGPNNVCRLTLSTGVSFYDLDRRVIYVRRAKLVGRTLPLTRMDFRDAPLGWEDHTGQPTGYVAGVDTGKFRIYRTPTAPYNGMFVDLMVVREPLADMAQGDSPEIALRYHMALLDWVSHRAYLKHDSQTYDPEESAKALATFEREFGTKERSSALEEEWVRNNLPEDECGREGWA